MEVVFRKCFANAPKNRLTTNYTDYRLWDVIWWRDTNISEKLPAYILREHGDVYTGNTFLRNSGTYPPNYTASHPKTRYPQHLLLRLPKISHKTKQKDRRIHPTSACKISSIYGPQIMHDNIKTHRQIVFRKIPITTSVPLPAYTYAR